MLKNVAKKDNQMENEFKNKNNLFLNDRLINNTWRFKEIKWKDLIII